MDRRAFLKTSLGAALAAGLPGLALPQARPQSLRPTREFRFSATPAKVNLGTGPDFVAWTYNGQVPGPEIRVREGETIRVLLRNDLPEPTTIHWHGVPVPNVMDGVPGLTQEPVAPGESFVYQFEAKPAGTYIYHSHAKYQLDQGLYGPLIIEPARADRAYDREYVLVLEDWVMRDGGGVAPVRRRPPGMGMMRGMMGRPRGFGGQGRPLLEPVYDAYGVNGKVYPAVEPLTVRRGDRVKLRLTNASSSTIYDLRLAGHSMTITHADGNPVEPFVTDVVRIGMGERYDVEFIADNPGRWLLAAYDTGFGEGRLRVPLHYAGIAGGDPAPPDFRPGLRVASYQDLRGMPREMEAEWAPAARVFSQVLSGGMYSPYWTINGRAYPDAEVLNVRPGEVARVRYWNHSMMPHPMHLHGHFFRVVNPALTKGRWILKDTIIVEPMQRVEVEFLAHNPGKWFHHCHNLYHMAAGMANVVTVGS